MDHFRALLQHQGPLKHVNHAHRVDPVIARTFGRPVEATGVARSTSVLAASTDAVALKAATDKFFDGAGDVFQNFVAIKDAMQTIMDHAAADRQYIHYLRQTIEYQTALVLLAGWVLVQASEPIWYEIQAHVIAFMHDTADRSALHVVWRATVYGQDIEKQFPNMLDRFIAFAQARGDAPMATKAGQLRERLLRFTRRNAGVQDPLTAH